MKSAFRPIRRQRAACHLSALLLFAVAAPADAAELLFNGDFETGTLTGWIAGGVAGGTAFAAAAGTCYSANDTSGITLSGNYAAALRSNPGAGQSWPDSIASLTSDPFVAGDGVVFTALTEVDVRRRRDPPVTFSVAVLDADGNELAAHDYNTSQVRLHPGCPSVQRDMRSSVHFIDTRSWLGRDIRIQFRQHTNVGGSGYFTLVDQVIRFGPGETPLFRSKPVAVAGTSRTKGGLLRLDASLSFDPDDAPLPLSYRWHIDGESVLREGIVECIQELDDGEHTVTLFVNDGLHVVADTMRFVVAGNEDPLAGAEGLNPGMTVSIEGCDEVVVDDEATDNDEQQDGGEDGAGDPGSPATGNTIGAGDSAIDSDNAVPVVDLDGDNGTTDGHDFTVVFSGAPVPIADLDTIISDSDDESLASAAIRLLNPMSGDSLAIDTGLLAPGIDATATADSILLNGTASLEDYAEAIAQVSFDNDEADPDPTTRTVSVVVSDGVETSGGAFAAIVIAP